MCNAWNHPVNCRCGWGGDGHLGKAAGVFTSVSTSPDSNASWAQAKYRAEAAGYTNPNARCPVCRASVYFYESPDGGRVYFDELGPPWPKHPCTINRGNGSAVTNVPAELSKALPHAGGTSRRYQWQADQWLPFVCERLAVVPTGICVAIAGLYRGDFTVLFIQDKTLVAKAPYQLKRRDESSYFLSTVQYQAGTFRVVEMIAYRHMASAVAAAKLLQLQPPPLTVKPASNPIPPRAPQPKPKRQKTSPNDVPPMTTLQIAFERAKTRGRGVT